MAPQTIKERPSKANRDTEERELSRAKSLQLGDGQQTSSSPMAPIVEFLDGNPILAVALFAGATQVVRALSNLPAVTMDVDIWLVLGFSCFCLGMHSPGLFGSQKQGGQGARESAKQTSSTRSGVRGEEIASPMPNFPEGAEIGSAFNCWSEPPASNFKVRGEKYLTDKKKLQSGPSLFPNRGVDLFLTELAPENVAR